MVTRITKQRKQFFQCDECLMNYRTEEQARECWCNKEKSSNDIMKGLLK